MNTTTSGSPLNNETLEMPLFEEVVEKNLAISYGEYIKYVERTAENVFNAFIKPFLKEKNFGFYVCNSDWWFEDMKEGLTKYEKRVWDEEISEEITKLLNIHVPSESSSDALGCYMPNWDGVDYL